MKGNEVKVNHLKARKKFGDLKKAVEGWESRADIFKAVTITPAQG